MTTTYTGTYDKPLSDLSSWKLKDDDQDIRGYNVYANPLDIIGVVDDMLVEKDAEVVSAIRLDSGEIIAASDIAITEDAVYLKNMYVAPGTPFVKTYEL